MRVLPKGSGSLRGDAKRAVAADGENGGAAHRCAPPLNCGVAPRQQCLERGMAFGAHVRGALMPSNLESDEAQALNLTADERAQLAQRLLARLSPRNRAESGGGVA